jgi:hypothetical protein
MLYLSMFHVVSNILPFISNEVLISLHNCLDSIHTNCPEATREVFNFLYKKTTKATIFVIHVLSNTLCRYFFIISQNSLKILPYTLSSKTHRIGQGYKLV